MTQKYGKRETASTKCVSKKGTLSKGMENSQLLNYTDADFLNKLVNIYATNL